jgi:hypothetical protein
MPHLTLFENADPRQPLVIVGNSQRAILRKLMDTAERQPDRCDGWTLGNPDEDGPCATITYIEGETDPTMQWEFYDNREHEIGSPDIGTFDAMLTLFTSRAMSNINFGGVPPGIERLAKQQVIR